MSSVSIYAGSAFRGKQGFIRSCILTINSEMRQKGEYSCLKSKLILNGRLALWIAGFIVASSPAVLTVLIMAGPRS